MLFTSTSPARLPVSTRAATMAPAFAFAVLPKAAVLPAAPAAPAVVAVLRLLTLPVTATSARLLPLRLAALGLTATITARFLGRACGAGIATATGVFARRGIGPRHIGRNFLGFVTRGRFRRRSWRRLGGGFRSELTLLRHCGFLAWGPRVPRLPLFARRRCRRLRFRFAGLGHGQKFSLLQFRCTASTSARLGRLRRFLLGRLRSARTGARAARFLFACIGCGAGGGRRVVVGFRR